LLKFLKIKDYFFLEKVRISKSLRGQWKIVTKQKEMHGWKVRLKKGKDEIKAVLEKVRCENDLFEIVCKVLNFFLL
jgi:AAA+ ATPase superfamily predicted ATPase